METEPQVRGCELVPERQMATPGTGRGSDRTGEGNKENVLCVQRGAGACNDGKEGNTAGQMGHGKDLGTCQDGGDTAPGFPFWGLIILQQQRQTGTASYTVYV